MRRRKETREEAVERADREARIAFNFQQALTAHMTDELPLLLTTSYDGWTVRLYATGLARCDGGTVVIRMDCKTNEHPYVLAYNALDYIAQAREQQSTFVRLSDESIANARMLETVQIASARAQETERCA